MAETAVSTQDGVLAARGLTKRFTLHAHGRGPLGRKLDLLVTPRHRRHSGPTRGDDGCATAWRETRPQIWIGQPALPEHRAIGSQTRDGDHKRKGRANSGVWMLELGSAVVRSDLIRRVGRPSRLH